MRNELRYGNLVLFRRSVSRVIEILFDYIQIYTIEEKGIEDEKYTEISPIPLNEKVLEACGFYTDENEDLVIDLGRFTCRWVDGCCDDKLILFTTDVGLDMLSVANSTSIDHLHQLQNLIHILTGTELQIDNEKLNEAVK